MSLFGAMISGVSGLNAQSQNLGVISDNISNLNTVGYKGTVGRFSTLVTESATNTRYTPGGVRFHPTALISKQGLLQATSSNTAAAISGDGFFVVRDTNTPGSDNEIFFTRAGDFKPDDDGYLRNTAGYYVQGWATDRNGGLLDPTGTATTSNSSAISDLQVLDINSILTAAASTTTIEFGANLNANETPLAGGSNVSTTLGINGTAALAGQAGIAAGDSFDITYNGTTTTITITGTDTLADIATKISAVTGVSATATTTGANDTLTINGSFADQNVVITNNNNTPLTALGFTGPFPATLAATYTGGNLASGAVAENNRMPVTIYDSLGSAHVVELQVIKLGQNRWGFELTGSTGADELDPTLHPNGLIQSGIITFNGDGSLRTFTDNAGTTSLVDQDIAVNWSNGSNANQITIDLGTVGLTNGITQFGAGSDSNGNLVEYDTRFINQNGAQAGSMVNYGFTEDGFLQVEFANGVKRPIYKLAIATFEAPDEMENHTGNVYRQTRESGDYLLREPGLNGAGNVVASALESSNVDLAEEFTNMIVTQRAYSANTKTITTTDEMLSELIRIKQ
ncbi:MULTISPECIES: flagellar hook protein FlgE [Thalassospira]|jgi:flagellar hook protein FlgE|uniref:Flagellar hook protein FlgE n=2 Tax=Thalassospira TaxID=168934 RepID=A0ABR5Y1I8_9PROT|nr:MULTISPECIES: flagellar hook-basal body complex protein [Thalassospira]MAL30160.1 flagellar biosynthesis protein FlgE [Thalassospira sp.]MBR9778504.1 flagellar hook-basal body complex protein [Rhodospirillales bacterium]KZD03764.1 flagellar biosynthesis protein FlgE [Thalassospira xiamenensis]KZD05883.1 flagellar biosynthesis protein FlgE [Thalassospira xiamenensis]MBL4842593.1 flagellar hook-basal body complex protein [Thalassospira sp.]|tara:strand:+ start:6887 stop:8599 length:1713 start_codon:yes stop_codon:yes gene_type:complete|eukprot:TRINITY_DN16173_c0_g1_i1.p1 TRINITY_DN16173_c0_g1~~TRINITY_DN16173_c0_g1_i1.p1  ORF type:complete len:571 (+),score=115.94 TRINITY_DN16173_c0_g1_i1:1494-3206(+)